MFEPARTNALTASPRFTSKRINRDPKKPLAAVINARGAVIQGGITRASRDSARLCRRARAFGEGCCLALEPPERQKPPERVRFERNLARTGCAPEADSSGCERTSCDAGRGQDRLRSLTGYLGQWPLQPP